MSPPCTKTAVNRGDQRGVPVGATSVSRGNARLAGHLESATISLITRRSQVQILPPPPIEHQFRGPFRETGKRL